MTLAFRKQHRETPAQRRASEPTWRILSPKQLEAEAGQWRESPHHWTTDLQPGLVYVQRGDRFYQLLPQPGHGATIARAHKAKPLRPASLLDRIPMFAAKPASILAISGPQTTPLHEGILGRDVLHESKGRPAARGWQAAQARFTALPGVTVVMSPKGRATLASPGGALPEGTVEVFEKVADWISAGRRGEAWPCDWCEREATDLLAGSVPACEEHAA